MSEYIASALILIGVFFMLVSSVGLLRLPDVYSRMHAATKATTFGMVGILAGTAITFKLLHVSAQALLAVLFFFLTAPVAAHLIARAAYRKGPNLADITETDEYGLYLSQSPTVPPAPENPES
ncbi:MAG: monovalent cation/H(+) antiporter subunit G [bacterium]|nr:monovalent cation/H(+) antiporter subunit G [bacterium]